jgi:hypothetical protein
VGCSGIQSALVESLGIASAVEVSVKPLSPDTEPKAEEIMLGIYRRMPITQKLKQVSELTRAIQEAALADIKRRHPDADERELKMRLASRWLDAETMRRVFGWDPEREGF